jgi:outer membrane lipoprotein SlyB
VRRGLLALAGLVAGALAAGAAYDRLFSIRGDRIDVYFDDGSFVTYVEGSAEADTLLPHARAVLAAVKA